MNQKNMKVIAPITLRILDDINGKSYYYCMSVRFLNGKQYEMMSGYYFDSIQHLIDECLCDGFSLDDAPLSENGYVLMTTKLSFILILLKMIRNILMEKDM